jgi:dTDP-4-dehydrorhamnose reductase
LGERAVPITRKDLDLTDLGAIPSALDDVGADALVNCAAYTQVDRAETEEDLATLINSEAVAVLAKWASGRSLPFLTFSTDYVFPGDASTPYVESSPTNPVNAYGRSKLGGEMATVDAGGLLVRTSWVISGSHPNFVATMIKLGQDRQLRVVDDQQGCPTVCADLAQASLHALEAGARGLLHITNQGPTTWFELARAALAEAGLEPETVSPCTTADYPTDAVRPAYSVLGSERLQGLGVTPPPHWRDSLPAVVAEIKTWI